MNKYRDIMAEINNVLLEIESKILIDFIVHVVEPEINFEVFYDKSMIFQSIYAGDNPSGFEDSIRLGIGNYYYSADALRG